jgi:SAM-dependent methyltransferase
MITIKHRAYQGLAYAGLPIYSARGVHEFVCRLISKTLPAGGRVLDVGSGSGALSMRLKNMGYSVTAMDLSPESASLEGVEVVKGDICSVAEAQPHLKAFDCVVAVELIEHLPNLDTGLRNLVSRLSETGFLIVTTPNVGHFVSRLRFLVSGAPSYFDENGFYQSGHRNILPQWLVSLLLTEQGLKARGMFHCGMSDRAERGYALSKLAGLLARAVRPDRWFDDGRITVFVASRADGPDARP